MNLGELRTAIQAEGYTTDTAAQQTLALNRVQENICGLARWPFLEKQDSTLTTVVGTGGYTPPFTDWRNFDAVRLEVTNVQQYVNLEYLSPQSFRDYEHVDRDAGTPFYWSFLHGELRFYPVPDSAYTVRIDYIANPTTMALDADVPILPVVYHDILVWGAIWRMGFRERDWLGRDFAQQMYQVQLKAMEEEYLVRQRQSGSRVKKSGYWNTQLPYPFTQDGF